MPTFERKPVRVLLVDSQPLMRIGLRTLLSGEAGFDVVGEAGDGEDAIIQVEALAPDVVIMDIEMSGLNGIEATRRILADAPDTRVIALSIHREKHFVDDMLKAGAAAYVLKDSAPEELVRAIDAALRGEAFLSPPILSNLISDYRTQEERSVAVLPIVQTKLHRPASPPDLVPRTRLLERLETRRTRPLTLVTAPAGYGKSLLISDWLEHCDWSSAWFSLDEDDSDLRQFLIYFVSAIRCFAPQACEQSLTLVSAPELPSVAGLAATLANELDGLEQPFILVLDDYHRIKATSLVNDLLKQLLTRPPIPLHLVLISRRDPAVPLVNLRASGQLTEIRMQDLRFSTTEVQSLFEKTLGYPASEQVLDSLDQSMEGWAVGLRLVSLASRLVEDPEAFLQGLHGGIQQIQEYLVQEVVARQPVILRDWLLKSAILDRFCAPLCDVVCVQSNTAASTELVGGRFIEALRDSNLFIIPLDSRGEWFRYHHLFQQLLRQQLEQQMTPEAIAQLHMRASDWFESKVLIDEAISHALAAGDPGRAAQIVERNRQHALDTDRWYDLEKWLTRLPEAMVQQRVELLMARVWVLFLHFRLETALSVVDRVESLLGDNTGHGVLRGEVSLMRGYTLFFLGDGAGSLKHIEEALKRLPASFLEARAQSEIIYALSSQMEGLEEQALSGLDELLGSYQSPNELRKTRLLVTYVFIHVISGDLASAGMANQRLKSVVDRNRYAYAKAWHDYLQGVTHLCRYELDEAVEFLGRSVSNRFIHQQRAALDSFAGLILAYQALGQSDDAEAKLQLFQDYVSILDDPQFWVLADSVSVRLAIMQGRVAPARRWLESSGPPGEKGMLWWLEVPCVSRCRALVAEGSSASLEEAQERLHEYAQSNEARHNNFHLIGILTLQAVAHKKQQKLEDALAVLDRVLTLAGRRDFLFPFLELGQPMIELLDQFEARKGRTDFVSRLIDRFQTSKKQHPITAAPRSEPSNGQITELLTNREFDILELLAQRLQNKEIASRLFVSPETVKTHLKHLYQKLVVGNRREAAARAVEILDGTRIGSPPRDRVALPPIPSFIPRLGGCVFPARASCLA